MTSLAVIVASSGRTTLARTLLSIAPQLAPGDELLVDVNDDAPWGHAARNRLMHRARAAWLLFLDDDDVYTPDALAVVRAELTPRWKNRMHVFRMRYPDGREIWSEPVLECGNVSTGMIVVPNCPQLGKWGDRYEGDWDFVCSTELALPARFHDDVITLVRP